MEKNKIKNFENNRREGKSNYYLKIFCQKLMFTLWTIRTLWAPTTKRRQVAANNKRDVKVKASDIFISCPSNTFDFDTFSNDMIQWRSSISDTISLYSDQFQSTTSVNISINSTTNATSLSKHRVTYIRVALLTLNIVDTFELTYSFHTIHVQGMFRCC